MTAESSSTLTHEQASACGAALRSILNATMWLDRLVEATLATSEVEAARFQACELRARALDLRDSLALFISRHRKPYASPTLRFLGKVEDLTRGVFGSADDGTGGMQNGGQP